MQISKYKFNSFCIPPPLSEIMVGCKCVWRLDIFTLTAGKLQHTTADNYLQRVRTGR